jgi:hypothetical protein
MLDKVDTMLRFSISAAERIQEGCMSIDQRFAVANLGYCEGLINSGTLDQQVEWQLRIRIAEASPLSTCPAKRKGGNQCRNGSMNCARCSRSGEEYDLASAIYPFEAAFCQGLSPKQAYDRFDNYVRCDDETMMPPFPPGFAHDHMSRWIRFRSHSRGFLLEGFAVKQTEQAPGFYENQRWMVGEIVLAHQILARKINNLRAANEAQSAVSQKLHAEEVAKMAGQLKVCADIIVRTSAEYLNRRPR